MSNIKIIDFGLSRDISATSTVKSLCSGTPFYIAPEVINRQVTLASDLWSLGVVMYVCLAGKLPFTGQSTEEIFANVLSRDLNIFTDPKLSHLSHEAKDLMSKLFRRSPSQRITAKQALEHPWLQLFSSGARRYRSEESFDKSR